MVGLSGIGSCRHMDRVIASSDGGSSDVAITQAQFE